MSEYQYDEFQAIDRPFTDRQISEVREISTRATITRTLFSNYYTYGDLKANPRDLLARYFDAALCLAHWHRLAERPAWDSNRADLRQRVDNVGVKQCAQWALPHRAAESRRLQNA